MASLASFKSTESISVKKDDKAFHALGQAFVGIDKSLLYKHAVCLLCQSDIKKKCTRQKKGSKCEEKAIIILHNVSVF